MAVFKAMPLCDIPSTPKRKTLRDICLESVGKNLNSISRLGRYLLTEHKETLIKRLCDHNKLTPGFAPHVTYNLFSPNITWIEFVYTDQLTNELLKQLSQCGCQLQRISLEGCQNVTDDGILYITTKQYSLKAVTLKHMNITKRALTQLKSHKLKCVNLKGSKLLENEGLLQVAKKNPQQITYLNIARCIKLTDDVIPQIAPHMGTTLEVLVLADVHCISDTSIRSIAQHCTSLKSIDLTSCNQVTTEGLHTLFRSCQQLKSVDLTYCNLQLANSNVFESLPKSVTELSLCGMPITSESLLVNSLCRLKQLKRLRLSGIPVITDSLLETLLEKIGPYIEELDLSGCIQETLSDRGLKYISQYCLEIKSLALALLKNITGTTLLPLLNDQKRAAKIRSLVFSRKHVNLEVLQAVATNCRGIVRLDMTGLTCVDDILLSTIADNCHCLADVNVKGCTQVTDVGVCELAIHCPIKVIVLSGLRNVSDKSVLQIANSCPYLEEIYLNGCYSVSRGAVLYLVDVCIPRVYWDHKIPNAKPDSTMVKNLDTGMYERVDNPQ